MLHRTLRRPLTAALLTVAAIGLSACGSSDQSADSSTTPPAATPVSLALDWTPNTNHIGVYVAQELGYYKQAGIDLKVLPYAETAPETLISSGKADFGFSYQAGIAYARAAGQDVRQVFANTQKGQYAIGVRADGDVQSPKDLDGKIYAGFGTPDEGPELKTVIQNDGGKGTFKTVALNTSAYEAVYNGRADFAISVQTWDGIEAKLRDKPVRYFKLTDYGFPEQYSTAIASSDAYLQGNGAITKGFLAATQRGYTYAADHPAEAAKLLIKANPQTLKNTQLVNESAKVLADDGYLRAPGKAVGEISPDVWDKYGAFLVSHKLLTGKDGKPLAAAPDWSEYFTNDYLPAS
jgi:ABC-type nitrate/sulfonate/bicarbonate transport system substrate-binding protein